MKNLLRETTDWIESKGHATTDVQFVMSNTSNWEDAVWEWCTWEEFAGRSDFEYDDSFGGEAINISLRIVGHDWWLERHEYDGSEWWEYKTLPSKPDTYNSRLRIRYSEDRD